MTHARRRCAAALAALAVGTLLAVQGCSPGTPALAADNGVPAVAMAQAAAIFDHYVRVSDQAAVAGDKTTGLSVVAGAAWEAAHAQYVAAAASGGAVPRYEYGTPVYYVPRVRGYPRWFVVSVPRRQAGTRRGYITTLMAFAQSKPHAVWTLDGAAALSPGQAMPAIARDSHGYAIALATDAAGLLVPPDIVGATHAAVVDEGPAAPAAAIVAPGAQTTGRYAEQAATASAMAAHGLSYTWLLEGAAFPLFALRTAGGGALVLYGMFLNTATEHPNLVKGAPIPAPATAAALLPEGEIGYHAVYVNWCYEFATLDPPASQRNGKLTVTAASGEPSYAHAY